MPIIGVSLGVDGGAIFQILAIENLGLSGTAIDSDTPLTDPTYGPSSSSPPP